MRKAINPMLLCDFYKTVHSDMINPKMTKSMSYYTPRMSRVKRWDKVVMFGLQGFIKTYLIDYFNNEFFNKPFDEVMGEYRRIMDATLGKNFLSRLYLCPKVLLCLCTFLCLESQIRIPISHGCRSLSKV